jgi:Predicted hydrolases or acyltransferases (alpha/beta hydrolase superfamily)
MDSWEVPAGARSISIEGYPLTYTEAGDGEPLLLIHGSLNDYRSWDAQVGAFQERYRTLAISLRHYYPEPWAGEGGEFSLSRHAADVIAFIRALKLSPVRLLGHSRGGAVAYMVARAAPELIRALVLAEPRGMEDLLPGEDAAVDGASSNRAIFDALHVALQSGGRVEAARAFIDAFNGPGSWAAMPARQQTIILDNIATGIDSGELPGMRCEDIARFTFPILLIRGEKSLRRYELGMEAMRRCNAAIEEVVVVPGAPHGMHRTNPEFFNSAVLDFLARN